jgi:hypothetical protein
MLAVAKLGFLVPGASHSGFPWNKLLTFNKSQLLIEFPCIRLTYLKLLSTVVYTPAHFYVHYVAPWTLLPGVATLLATPPPATSLDVDTTRQKDYRCSLHYSCIELLLRERENTNIDSFFTSWDWLSPVAMPSKAWVCGHSLAGIWIQIPPETWMSVSCECCVLSEVSAMGRPLISEESYQVCVHAWERSGARLTLHLGCAIRRGQTKKERRRNFVTR